MYYPANNGLPFRIRSSDNFRKFSRSAEHLNRIGYSFSETILTIVNGINALQIFKLFFGTTFLLKGWSKLYGSIDMCTYINVYK